MIAHARKRGTRVIQKLHFPKLPLYRYPTESGFGKPLFLRGFSPNRPLPSIKQAPALLAKVSFFFPSLIFSLSYVLDEMATAVLPPSHDCLKIRSVPKMSRNTCSNSSRTVRRKRRYPAPKDASDSTPTVVKLPSHPLVMENVTILKRGQDLKSLSLKGGRSGGRDDAARAAAGNALVGRIEDEDSLLCSTGRLGPEPELVPRKARLTDVRSVSGACRDSLYAGAAFFSSPSPSSLPFPAFFAKKNNDLATKDLRRLLRIEP
ncbi:hypothetical protein ACLOJK_002542 [Asimina triloba]